jgi:hypothetical protein
VPAVAIELLDNIMWNSLTGPHSKFAAGSGDARRYAKGFSPIVGFRDPERPDLAALAPFCEPGEHFYCDIWSGPAPEGWQIEKMGFRSYRETVVRVISLRPAAK